MKINLHKNNYSCFNLNVPNKSSDFFGYKSANYFYDKKYSINENSKNQNSDDTERFKEIDQEIRELEQKYGIDDL